MKTIIKRLTPTALFFFIIAVALPNTASAATRYVNPAGGLDPNGLPYFLTIQAAINAASNGDTIEVAAGIYHEELLITKPLIINGEDNAVLDGSTLGSKKVGVKIKSGNVTFNNIDVANFSGNGIIVGYEAPIPGSLLNVHITNCMIANIQPGYLHGFGIYVGYEAEAFKYVPPALTSFLDYSGLLIENNEIKNTRSSALVLQSIIGISGQLVVENNNIGVCT